MKIIKSKNIKYKIINFIFLFCLILSIYVLFLISKKIINLPQTNSFDITGKYLSPWSIYYFSLHIIASIFTIFFALSFKMSYELKAKFLTSIISIGISLCILELFLAFPSDNLDFRIHKAKEIGIEFDTRSKSEVIDNLKNEGHIVYPNFTPSLLLNNYKEGLNVTNDNQIFPLSNISDISSILTNENGYYPIVKTDKYGFTNEKNLYTNNPIDIMLIGDSYVEGYSVHPNENISSNLNNADFKTINLGKGGNGPLLELATLREYASPHKPKIVIWFFLFNDFHNLYYELRSDLLTNYLLDTKYSQNLINNQNKIDATLKKYIDSKSNNNNLSNENKLNLNKFIEIIKLSRLKGIYLNTIIYSSDKINNKLLKDILINANDTVESWGGKLYFVYLPSKSSLQSGNAILPSNIGRFSFKDNITPINAIHDICSELNITVIDFYNIVYNSDDHDSFFPQATNGHYNSKGYKLLTDNIIKKIQ